MESKLHKSAYKNSMGDIIFYHPTKFGCYHREDGPAVIWTDGAEHWYLDNKQYKTADNMPLNLFLAYCRWEYIKKHGK